MTERLSNSEILNRNIPEALQDKPFLKAYLNAAGEFLDGSEEAILNFMSSHDYEKGTNFNLIRSLEDMGFQIPTLLSEDLKRVILRDAVELFLKNGTEDSLIWVLKIIGLDPEVRYAWLPSPREVRRGYITDPISKETSRYDVDKFAYTRFLYGEEVVTEDGVFFEGFRYEDARQEELISDLPILGQQYDKAPTGVPVAKTPYAIVRIGAGDFNTVTDPYVDPETGEVFEYTQQEEFEVVNELLDYFLFQASRAANVKVIVVVSLQELVDELTIDDSEYEETWYNPPEQGLSEEVVIDEDFSDTTNHEPTDFDDVLELEEELEQETVTDPEIDQEITDDITVQTEIVGEGTVDTSNVVIGDAILIGKESPYQGQFSIIQTSSWVIGTNEVSEEEIYVDDWTEFTVNNQYDFGRSHVIPIRPYTEIQFTAPTDSDVEVYVRTDFYDDSTETLFDTVLQTDQFNQIVPPEYHGVRIKIVDDTDEQIEVVTNYRNASSI